MVTEADCELTVGLGSVVAYPVANEVPPPLDVSLNCTKDVPEKLASGVNVSALDCPDEPAIVQTPSPGIVTEVTSLEAESIRRVASQLMVPPVAERVALDEAAPGGVLK